MAQKINIILTDDLDGGEATETVRFGLDGGQFEIDLSAENAQALRDSVRPFKDKARKVTPGASRRGSGNAAARVKNSDTPKIREWAQANGYNVSARGRIHQDVQDAYYAAQKDS